MKTIAVAAALIAACVVSQPSGDFKPPEQYPEWSLEDQAAAMKAVEEERRKNRVEGLRDKTPPADWIAHAYHGLVLDANFDEIELDPPTVRRMQESLFAILYPQTRDAMIKRFGSEKDIEVLFFGQQSSEKDRMLVRSAVLDEVLTLAGQKLREQYVWRNDLMNRGVSSAFDWSVETIHPTVLDLLRQYDLRLRWPVSDRRGIEYVEACEEQEVPIPPDWPDARWVRQGALAFTFISMGRTAEVYTYKDPDVPGVCYALPRKDPDGQIMLLSITCQSKRTGKACFWDNKTLNDGFNQPVRRMEIRNSGNGFTLGENCTGCHRGYNAYNIHPGTALDLTRASVVPAPYDPGTPWFTNHDVVRYSPIGSPAFVNPPPLDATVLPPPPPLANGVVPSCTLCHEIPRTYGDYCGDVLTRAMNQTMPPPSPYWTRADFSDHITRLSACP